MTLIVRPLRSGQITIPAQFRVKLGITPQTLLQVQLIAGELRVKPLKIAPQPGGQSWFKELYDLFAPVRAEAKKYSEKEIDKAIDEAVAAVRKNKHG